MAELSHEPVPMNATPSTNFEMIQSQFLFCGTKAGFDCPATERYTQQPSQSDTVTADDLIGKEVFDFAGANITSDDYGVLLGWKFVDRLPPETGPFDFPYFRTTVGVFNAVALPALLCEYWRVSCQVIDAAAGIRFTNSRNAARSAVLGRFRRRANDFRLAQPTMKIAGYFANERLAKFIQVVEELGVSSVKFVERPRAHTNAIGQRVFDLVDGDLWLGFKLNFIGHVVFLRREASSA